MKVTRKTHPRPELEFVDVDLLTLYRQLNEAGEEAGEEWSRAVRAGCLEMVAAAKDGRKLPDPASAAKYRKMLRQLLELERTAPPPARSRVTSSKRRSGSSVGRASA